MYDVAMLEKFISEHYAAMKNLALRFVKSPDIAEDIVQEIIISFWNKRDDSVIHSMNNFLYTTVKNRCLDHIKSSKREGERYKNIDSTFFENTVIEQDLNQILVDSIDHLPQRSGDIIRLVLSGYTNKEISSTIGISINTVKTLKYGAIKKMREFFLARQEN